MIKELMRKLRGAQTVEHWEGAIRELETSIQETTANLGLLRTARKSALFEQQSEEEVAMLQQRIRHHEDELEMLKDNLDLARSRRDEAEEAETTTKVEQRMTTARKDLEKLLSLWKQYDGAIGYAGKHLDEMRKLQSAIVDANNFAAAAGRGDMALSVNGGHAFGQIRNLLRQLDDMSKTAELEEAAK